MHCGKKPKDFKNMKTLSIILSIIGSLFIIMGFYFKPMVPPILLGLLFFFVAILFWRNSNDYKNNR